MTTQKTRISTIRESYSKNGSLILKKAEITELEYNDQMFRVGCHFLEELYLENESYYKKFAYTQSFWQWWYAEWKKFEAEYLGYLYENKQIATKTQWQTYMSQMALDSEVEHSYHNQYLKIIYNGRI